MTGIPFSKYSGCGNHFILIDQRRPTIKNVDCALIKGLCHPANGIGANGVIFLENSDICDAKMRIFNADGSQAEMCGNGLRCLAQFMLELGFPDKRYTIETMERQLTVETEQKKIKTSMGPPASLKLDLDLTVNDRIYRLHYLDTGVPHSILFVENIENVPILEASPPIRNHQQFAPKGTNVNFVKILSSHSIAIRTFERGVEGETEACGTGCVAAAIISSLKHSLTPPIQVITRSNETLMIDFTYDLQGNIENVFQTGTAIKTFHGVFNPQTITTRLEL